MLGNVGLVIDVDGAKVETANPSPAATWSAAYHPGIDRVIALDESGATLGYDPDTDTWVDLRAGAGPDRQVGFRMVYDEASNRVVLFGGARDELLYGDVTGLPGTWIFDSGRNAWDGLAPEVEPQPRYFQAMTYDAGSDRVVLFGGATARMGEVLGDTWVYDTDAGTWTEMHAAVSPPARLGAAMWYDPVADLVFLYGGSSQFCEENVLGYPVCYPPWSFFGGEELWAYDVDSNSWTLYRVERNPGFINAGSAAFDTQSGVAVLAGGEFLDAERRYRGPTDEVWIYRHQR